MTPTRRGEKRADALTKERIVDAAIQILDDGGEGALTFRALSGRLSTGSGAIYWHVANKSELLAAATESVVADVMADLAQSTDPRHGIRAIASGVFDAIDAHPWAGAQLSGEPAQDALLRVFEGIGTRIDELQVPENCQFTCASALVNYILGVAGQNAANARNHDATMDRTTFLAGIADRWTKNDPATYPFVHKVAAQLPRHDDREQFLSGVDLFLAGIDAVR